MVAPLTLTTRHDGGVAFALLFATAPLARRALGTPAPWRGVPDAVGHLRRARDTIAKTRSIEPAQRERLRQVLGLLRDEGHEAAASLAADPAHANGFALLAELAAEMLQAVDALESA
jgi:hypothetical protein